MVTDLIIIGTIGLIVLSLIAMVIILLKKYRNKNDRSQISQTMDL